MRRCRMLMAQAPQSYNRSLRVWMSIAVTLNQRALHSIDKKAHPLLYQLRQRHEAQNATATSQDPEEEEEATQFRVEFELWGKGCPNATENFARLCTGDMVLPAIEGRESAQEPTFKDQFLPQVHYVGSEFHSVHPGRCVQAGRIEDPQGRTVSVFGEEFSANSELNVHKFDRPYLLGTSTAAPGKNTSEFFVTLCPDATLDGVSICFGQVSKGQEVIDAINKSPLGNGKPIHRFQIVEAGMV